MPDIYVEVLETFERSNYGDDVLVYEAGGNYPFPADKAMTYQKAGKLKIIEAKQKKPKSQRKKKVETEQKETENG